MNKLNEIFNEARLCKNIKIKISDLTESEISELNEIFERIFTEVYSIQQEKELIKSLE